MEKSNVCDQIDLKKNQIGEHEVHEHIGVHTPGYEAWGGRASRRQRAGCADPAGLMSAESCHGLPTIGHLGLGARALDIWVLVV